MKKQVTYKCEIDAKEDYVKMLLNKENLNPIEDFPMLKLYKTLEIYEDSKINTTILRTQPRRAVIMIKGKEENCERLINFLTYYLGNIYYVEAYHV